MSSWFRHEALVVDTWGCARSAAGIQPPEHHIDAGYRLTVAIDDHARESRPRGLSVEVHQRVDGGAVEGQHHRLLVLGHKSPATARERLFGRTCVKLLHSDATLVLVPG